MTDDKQKLITLAFDFEKALTYHDADAAGFLYDRGEHILAVLRAYAAANDALPPGWPGNL